MLRRLLLGLGSGLGHRLRPVGLGRVHVAVRLGRLGGGLELRIQRLGGDRLGPTLDRLLAALALLDLLALGRKLLLAEELLGPGHDVDDVVPGLVRVGEIGQLLVAQRLEDRDRVGREPRERLVHRETAERRARQRGVRAAAAADRDGLAAPARLLLVLLLRARRRGELGLGLDVDAPAREAGGEAGVLALAPDRQRELVVGDDDRRLLGLVVHEDLADTGGRQRLGDEARRIRVPRDDVDLLAAELGDDHADARAARADAGADGIDAGL